jgi:hypothetical protein
VQLHLNGYALMAAVYLALENVAMAWAPTATLAIGAVHGGLAWWLRGPDRRASLHALAVALGAVTIACALRLDGPSLTVALAIEGAFVVALGLTIGELWFRLGGAGLLVFAVMRYFGLSLPAKPTVFALFQDEPFAVGVFLALVLYGVALVYRRHDQETLFEKRSGMTLAVLGASALLVVALSAESQLYWDLRGDYSADARFAASLMLSFVWTICAGRVHRRRPAPQLRADPLSRNRALRHHRREGVPRRSLGARRDLSHPGIHGRGARAARRVLPLSTIEEETEMTAAISMRSMATAVPEERAAAIAAGCRWRRRSRCRWPERWPRSVFRLRPRAEGRCG